MRTQLSLIGEKGGALLRPLYVDYPTDEHLASLVGESVMFGEHVLVHFAMKPELTTKTVYFPGYEWLDLETFTVFNQEAEIDNIQTINISVTSQVKMYQRGNGTIIALIDT
jgi:alpha-glucosidase (family GH31 glycosyl hydrolase)